MARACAVPRRAVERERALALEDFFDEELGHEVRRVALDAARRNPEIADSALGLKLSGVARPPLGTLRRLIHLVAARYYGITPETVDRAMGEDRRRRRPLPRRAPPERLPRRRRVQHR